MRASVRHAGSCGRALLLAGLLAGAAAPAAMAEEAAATAPRVQGGQIGGPGAQPRDAWLQALRDGRSAERARTGYDDALYRQPALAWAQRDFIQPQAMVEDRFLYDPVHRRYTVDRYLDDLARRYGGIDSVLLWPVYPNIGIDDRNQWDLLRDMPGGVAGVRAMVGEFHRRGVRVLFPTMPWDTGTRDPGASHAEATVALMAQLGADGLNGDTLAGLPREFQDAAEAHGVPLLLEPELSPPDAGPLAWNLQGWAYWTFPPEPKVSAWKWFEPRHLEHVCERWATDRTDLLQAAFFNGVGLESWENVWGVWNGYTARDAEAQRRIATLFRALAPLLASEAWEPHVPVRAAGVYASAFPGEGRTLYTLVNRGAQPVRGEVLALPARAGVRYVDAWNGRPLAPRLTAGEGAGEAVLSLALEPRGYAAVLAVDDARAPVDPSLRALLARMRSLSARPLQSYATAWRPLPQRLVPIEPTPRPRPGAALPVPDGMVRVPGGHFEFRVEGVEIEGDERPGVDVQYPWEDVAQRHHAHGLELPDLLVDRHPVTNADYKRFIDATHYHPADDHNFLRHWLQGAPRPGDERRPVTWVSIEDARAYARWAGKRLPHEWEWQHAAQGGDGRPYPWGGEWRDANVPAAQSGRVLLPPDAVDAHPGGASAAGVEDLVGNVWQWTDEYTDEHTRAAVLRGGGSYRPSGSGWYFPSVRRLDQHGKYLLMAPSKDRSGMIGFRCVRDL